MNDLDDFIRTASRALGVDVEVVDRDLVLHLAKVVAHQVARPAAPVAAFLVGLAAGSRGASAAAVRDAAATVVTLANAGTGHEAEERS